MKVLAAALVGLGLVAADIAARSGRRGTFPTDLLDRPGGTPLLARVELDTGRSWTASRRARESCASR